MFVVCAAVSVVACGAVGLKAPSTHGPRDRILAAIDARDSTTPLQLRYNPAPCACPPFEVMIGDRWIRAEWRGARTPAWRKLTEGLAATAAPHWPVLLQVSARIDREVRRTRAGTYAVTIEVIELLSP